MARLLFAACVVLVFCSSSVLCAKDEEEPRLVKVVEEAVKDFSDTITKSKNPVGDLSQKYAPQVKKMATGTIAGYAITYVVKRLAISVAKAVSLGVAIFSAGILFGWVGKEKGEELKREAWAAEAAARNKLDLNKDGKIDLEDIKEIGLRVERALLKHNIPQTFGFAVGGVIALLSATFNPFD